MSLTSAAIQSAASDDELFNLLSNELSWVFPPEIQDDPERFLAALPKAPRGLRAMATIHALDVSMSLDDLGWHFLNNNDERLIQETAMGLQELEAKEAADIFLSAWALVKPHMQDIERLQSSAEEPQDFLDSFGIQEKMDPLSERMWALCESCGQFGLMSYWLSYARKHPANCTTDKH